MEQINVTEWKRKAKIPIQLLIKITPIKIINATACAITYIITCNCVHYIIT